METRRMAAQTNSNQGEGSMAGQTSSNQGEGNYNNLPGQRKRAKWSDTDSEVFYRICVELVQNGTIMKRQGLLTDCEKWIISAMMEVRTGVRYTANQIANKWATSKNLYDTDHKGKMLPYYKKELTRRVRRAGNDFFNLKKRRTPHAELLETIFDVPIKFVNNESEEVATDIRGPESEREGQTSAPANVEDTPTGGAFDYCAHDHDAERDTDCPQHETTVEGEGAAGSVRMDEGTRCPPEDKLDFTGTAFEESILDDKKELKELSTIHQDYDDKLKELHTIQQDYGDKLYSLAKRAHQRADTIREAEEAKREVESLKAELKHVKEEAAKEVQRVKQKTDDQLAKAKQEMDQLLRQKGRP